MSDEDVNVPQKKDSCEYRVGDLDKRGRTITHIYGLNQSFIVYTTGIGDVSFETTNTTEWYKLVLREFTTANSATRTKLRGTFKKDTTEILGMALSSALRSSPRDDPGSFFTSVYQFIDENGPVKHIYGIGSTYRIFQNKNGQPIIEFENISKELHSTVGEFKRLLNIIDSSLPKKYRQFAYNLLGDELASAFRADPSDSMSNYFDATSEFVEKRVTSVLIIRYNMYNIFAAVVAVGIFINLYLFFSYYENIDLAQMSLGCVGSVLGALISVMQREKLIAYDRFITSSQVIGQGCTRIALGIVFGVVAVVGIKANIFLGLAKDNIFSLFTFCVVAGFSERLVPDFLTRMADEQGEKKGQPSIRDKNRKDR